MILVSCKKSGTAGKSVFAPTIQGLNLTIDAGIDVAQVSPTTSLDATSSTAEGKTFTWSKVSGPGTVIFGNASSEDTIATVSLEGTYVLSVQVTASSGDTATDTVTFIYDTTAPVVDAGLDATFINSPFFQNASASDTNTLSYSWSVDAGPGNLSAAHVLNPGISVDADGSYTIRLTVTDVAGNSSFDTFLLDWDSTPPSTSAGSDKIVSVGTLQDATVTDLNTITYSWSKVSGPGNITFTPTSIVEDPTISADTDGDYVIRLTAMDSFGNYSTDDINFRWDTTIPTVSEVRSSQSDGSYGSGVVLSVEVVFNENVDVTGTPLITLEMGAIDKPASYTAGSGTPTLTFQYTVASPDSNLDLGYVATNSLVLNGGTIRDSILNNANLMLAVPGTPGSISDDQAVVIDTTPPTVSQVAVNKADGAYGAGETMMVGVFFDEPVTVVGSPQLTLETGITDAILNYSGGSGSTTLTFNYTVSSGETSSALDYQGVGSLTLAGGSIRDLASNAANLTLPFPGGLNSISDDQIIEIDTSAPNVTEVRVNLTDGVYGISAVIPVEVLFDEPVNVTGFPQITLETGPTDDVVNYSTGSGSQTLTFNYTVGSGDMNADLDYLSSSALVLNGGTITDGPNSANLTLPAPGGVGSISDNQGIIIDTSNVSVQEVRSTKADGQYLQGEVIDVLVDFSGPVTVTGLPVITLETGVVDESVQYFAGTGTDTLTFRYTVQNGNYTSDLDYLSANSLTLNGGTINDLATNPAILTLASPGSLNSISDNQNISVDADVPTVSQVRSTKPNGSYNSGEEIDILVEFNEVVYVAGLPEITLEAGVTDVAVSYISGSGSDTLTFKYTVTALDNNLDLDYVSTNSLVTGGGTIQDGAGNNANLTLALPATLGSISDDQNIVIDNTIPYVSQVRSSNADGGYSIGATISIEVLFDEAVTVSGSPQITLELGVTDKPAIYFSGAGSNTLTFNYTVGAGDSTSDLDYSSTFALSLLGGAINDLAGNAANLNLASPGTPNSISDDQQIAIDTVAPTLNQVLSFKPDGTYGVGSTVDILVQYNENVAVTGTPLLTLETGVIDEVVSYSSGSGSNFLTFTYSISDGNVSGDLDYQSSSSLNLNGGTIKDLAGNDAPIALAFPGTPNSISDDKAIVIDGTVPSVLEVKSPTIDGGYKAGQVIQIYVVFNEPVNVSGLPQLTLETGTTDTPVNYSAGTGTDTLTFNYTVGVGNLNTDLDYISTTALSFNGGSIADSVPNSADVTLATPGALNSISDDKGLLVDAVLPVVDAGIDLFTSASATQNATITEDTTPTIVWSKVSGPGLVLFSNPNIEDPDITATLDGSYVVQLQVTDQGGNVVTDTINFDWDTTPPPALDGFSAVTTTSINNAMIDITVDFPINISDYYQVQIRGTEGGIPPLNCNSGQVIKTYNVSEFIDETYSQNTGFPGGFFSARACIRDQAGNSTSLNTFSAAQASDKHKAFMTSQTWNGDFSADFNAQSFPNGQAGADYRCQYLADTAGISTSVDKWVAVLSFSWVDARSYIAINGPVYKTTGVKVVDNKFDLWDSSLDSAIDRDEYQGSTATEWAYTGTLAGGIKAAVNCNDFTDGTAGATKRYGYGGSVAAAWVSQGQDGCDFADRIYCISQYKIADNLTVNLSAGALGRQIDYDITLPNHVDVERFYQKVEVYRKTSAGAPTHNCDGSDGSTLARTFNGPFSSAQNLTHTDVTPDAPGTSYNFTICTYDNDGNVVVRDEALGVTSGL